MLRLCFKKKPLITGFGGEALFLCCLSLINEPSAAVTTLILAAGCSGFGIAGIYYEEILLDNNNTVKDIISIAS